MTPSATILSGGLGGARLAAAVVEAGMTATFVVNVADDAVFDGLLVCPDVDAVFYSLAGVFDDERGWGVRGDVFPDTANWFNIGRLDRRHHERRQAMLDMGMSLSDTMALLVDEANLGATVIPVSNDPVRTHVCVGRAWTTFQEWLVRDHAPSARSVRWDGIDGATCMPAALEAIKAADIVVLAPSSPIASLAPILGVGGVAAALADRRAAGRDTVAVSPIASRRPVRCERDQHRAAARARLLAACGMRDDPVEIARWLAPHISTFVLDDVDAEDATCLGELGLEVRLGPTVGDKPLARARLLHVVLGEDQR